MEIIPRVHRVPKVKGANAYLLLGSKLTLVDTGMPGNAEVVLRYIQELGYLAMDLTRIILTHHHVDHVGSLAAIKRQTPACMLAHPDDEPIISGKRAHPLPQGLIMNLLYRIMPAMTCCEPASIDVPANDGARLDILGGATVVHAPGHTPGSIALHFPAERLLICGDAINRRGNRLGLPLKPFTADMEQAFKTAMRLCILDFEILCPGHGDPIIGGAATQILAMLKETV